MDELPLVERLVRTLAAGLRVPVSVKIRIFADLPSTLAYARMLQAAGASLLAVHGRTREQKKAHMCRADWDAIRVRSRKQLHACSSLGCEARYGFRIYGLGFW